MYRLNLCRYSVFFFGLAAYAQLPIDFGIKGGLSLTDAYNASNAKDYIAGLSVELRLVKDISVEADGLYRPVNFVSVPTGVSRYAGFEFPVLAKYRLRLPVPILRPVLEAGPSFRAHASSAPDLTVSGFTAGGGIEFRLLVIRLSSDLRYTRWQSQSNSPVANPNVNQVELLFGVAF